MNGWIKLHRKLMRNALWRDCNANQKVVMITLLMMASHEDNKWMFKGEEYSVQPGQFVTSLQTIAENAGVTVNVVRKSLMKLEKYDFCTNVSTNKNRLITIENWAKYQDENIEKNIEQNKQGTSKEQARNNYQECKNDKNERNKELYSDFLNGFHLICPSIAKVIKLTDARKRSIKNTIEEHGLETIKTVLEKTEASDFLTGRAGDFKASFDWILKPANFIKILEGNYDNRKSKSKPKLISDETLSAIEEYERLKHAGKL